jgi:hypothetical protein
VEILKKLLEAVCRKRPEPWPNIGSSIMTMQKALSVKEFLAQKSITKTEHPPYSPDLALNDF